MAFKVKYDGNGNTSGLAPVDNNSYNAGDTVQVLEPFLPRDGITVAPPNTIAGTLARAVALFAYWNTMPDGTGTGYYWPAGGSSFQITSNVTIYAQWFITAGLHNGGATTHYAFGYDSALQTSASNPTGLEPARTNQLVDACEADYQILSNWFGGKYTLDGVVTVPIQTFVANLWGGANASSIIVLKPGSGNSDFLRCLLVAEVTEYFMHAQNKGWGFVGGVGNEESSGEALSLFLTQQFALLQSFANPYTLVAHTANGWLNSSLPTSDPNSTRFFDGPTGYDYGSRADYINSIRPYPGNGPGTGCSILFLHYLYHQLGFSIQQIIAAAPGFTNGNLNSTATLRGVYQNLTGDAGDPFPFFSQLLAIAFPPDAVSSIPGPNTDDPFPLAKMSFWVDKSTFGKDEVQDVISASGGNWPKAFWLVVEGFSKNTFNSFGGGISLSGSFAKLAGVSITQNPDIDFENAANPQAPQRIRVPFDISFSGASFVSFPASGSTTYDLDSFLAIGGAKVPGSDASTQFQLVAGADPYFTNIDPTQNNVYYLSQDLRVFAANPAQDNRPVPGAPIFPNSNSPSTTDAYNYIQSLLNWLNSNNSDTSGPDPFKTLVPSQGGALNGDSSVSPNNYNFAVARVRLRGSAGPAGAASNVRVFFRLWSTETADADYQTDSSYPSTPDAAGLPASPLVGADHQTLPFFASGNFSINTDYGMGGANTRDIQIASGKDSIWAYFGCFLNVYDPTNVIDGNPVQAWLNGTHHCIVAQIAYDGAPVVPGASPVNSDKLAQRNLQITLSDNPGGAETHRIPQTFDIRPSAVLTDAAPYPDELMIDWGTVPPGSVASIYWPQVLASDVIALASHLYSSHTLTPLDANTIQCKVTAGVTYIPIPPGGTQSFAGLFIVDLPTTVVAGQEFNIVVRRISSRMAPPTVEINLQMISPPPPDSSSVIKAAKGNFKLAKAGGAVTASALVMPTKTLVATKTWRYVVGTFQVKIPVVDGSTMLFPEENTLAIMKWRLQQMAPANRWYPVLQRYVSYISARVAGLGGDPNAIPPSLSGAPITDIGEKETKSYTGKICEVIYDCFGDFEGFVLESCCSERRLFKTREKTLGELAFRACRDRLSLTVMVGKKDLDRVCGVRIR
jgi:hypothetical protein